MIEGTRKRASVVHIDARHNSSRAQGFEQAISDTRDKQNQSLPGSVLQHGSFSQGASLLATRAKDADAGNPTKGKHENTSTSGFNSAADALRGTTRFDPARDPTSGGNQHDDLIRSGRASGEELTALLGHSSSTDSASTNGGSTNPSSGHSDPQHARLGSMLSTDVTSAGTAPVPVGYDDEGVHTAKTSSSSNTELNRIGTLLGTGGASGPARCAIQQALKEQDATGTGQASGNSNCEDKPKTADNSKKTDNNSAHNGITTSTSADGTKTSTSVNSHTITVVHPNGATETFKCDDNGLKVGDKPIESTPPLVIPDPEHQSTVPAGWDNLLKNDVKQMQQASHDGDAVNVVDGIPGMVDRTATTGALVDEKARLLGGDQGHDGLQDGGGSGNGTGVNGTTPGHLSGVTDPGPDSDQAVHGSGQDERSHETFKHESPNASADAPQGRRAGAEDSATPTNAVETPALVAAHELVEAAARGTGSRLPQLHYL